MTTITKIIAISLAIIAAPQGYKFSKTLYEDTAGICKTLYEDALGITERINIWTGTGEAAKKSDFQGEYRRLVYLNGKISREELDAEIREFQQKYYRQ